MHKQSLCVKYQKRPHQSLSLSIFSFSSMFFICWIFGALIRAHSFVCHTKCESKQKTKYANETVTMPSRSSFRLEWPSEGMKRREFTEN